MFRAAGAHVKTIGFHRRPLVGQDPELASLGLTYDADFPQRVRAVLAWALKPGQLRRFTTNADVVVARNLEMLLLAWVALVGRSATPLIYECLDLHRLMLGRGPASMALRALERWLLRRVSHIVISSPAFERCYFVPRHGEGHQIVLVENRMLVLAPPSPSPGIRPRPSGAWTIGWFGMIRCRRSLLILSELAARSQGRIEVVIRGRPSTAEFADLAAEVALMPHVRFEGAYAATELPTIYSEVDFVWAIDFFEAGLNSSWLLPNRLYEGGVFNRPVIAQEGVETARWLSARGAGVIVHDPLEELQLLFRTLTPEAYAGMVRAAERIPRSDLICDPDDCRAFMEQLSRRGG